jgi:hypothetical protein
MADTTVREHILTALRGVTERRFEAAMKDFPMDQINTPPPHVPYTPWGLLEHLRVSQVDILEYITNPNYAGRKHPVEYWPPEGTVADAAMWERSMEEFRRDAKAMEAIVADPETDLVAAMPHTPGHTVLREALLIINHISYHLGEFGILREVMQTWPPEHYTSSR